MAALMWKTKNGEKGVQNLSELLNEILSSQQDALGQLMEANRENLIAWLEREHPDEVLIIAHLGDNGTPQQIMEQLVRDLRAELE